ncbi:MAG: hypothetical protein D3923_09340 [Candidatus Electrothrix sp. AR3]|nr:hypothetical protein [Candidatus Electrothrix sp. AR3]
MKNVRTGNGTSQRIVLNLGIDFFFPKESWRSLAKRIEQILYGQRPLFAAPDDIEVAAQQYAAKIIRKQGIHLRRESLQNQEIAQTVATCSSQGFYRIQRPQNPNFCPGLSGYPKNQQ